MDGNLIYIINYSEGHLKEVDKLKFEEKLRTNKEFRKEYLKFRRISESIRARFDIEEVHNDPAFENLNASLEDVVSDFNRESQKNQEALNFIIDSIRESEQFMDMQDEINQIKYEISESNVNEISEGWVKEWHEKGMKSEVPDREMERIKSFIEGSQSEKDSVPGKNKIHRIKPVTTSLMIRFGGLAAAVIISGMIYIKIADQSSDPERIFQSYYQTIQAISPVTRSSDPAHTLMYAEAIDLYKNGNYEMAAARFSEVDNFLPARFYEGSALIELGQYSEAIAILTEVASVPNDYNTDARWNLALAYLKSGEKAKALKYFEEFSGTEGYYRERAIKILRRLK